jgi:transposase
MDHIQGTDRYQLTLFPEAPDDYISQDNPVRFIDAFVDSLDLQSLGFAHAIPATTGRPPYHPGDLLGLYVYGYLNRIQSSRANGPIKSHPGKGSWTQSGARLAPGQAHPRLPRGAGTFGKTIADFRKDKRKAIRQACRAFVLLCRDLDLFGAEAGDATPTLAPGGRHRVTHFRHARRVGFSELLGSDDLAEALDQLIEQFWWGPAYLLAQAFS